MLVVKLKINGNKTMYDSNRSSITFSNNFVWLSEYLWYALRCSAEDYISISFVNHQTLISGILGRFESVCQQTLRVAYSLPRRLVEFSSRWLVWCTDKQTSVNLDPYPYCSESTLSSLLQSAAVILLLLPFDRKKKTKRLPVGWKRLPSSWEVLIASCLK